MNFIKDESSRINNLYDILSERYQQKLREKLYSKGHLNKELDDIQNTTAYVSFNNERYPNKTYAFAVSSLKEMDHGIELFIEEFSNQVPEHNHVSFRMPITIEKQETGYHMIMRATMIPPVCKPIRG